MTVSAVFPAQKLAADGVTTVFPFTFKAQSPSDIEVVTVDANGNETVVPGNQVTVTLSATGGNATFGVAPALGLTVFMRTAAALQQAYKINTQQKYDPSENQQALDQLAIILKQIEVDIERCIKIPQNEVLNSLTVTLSSAATRANGILGFDPNGNVTIVPTGGPFAGLTPGRVLFASSTGTITQSSSLYYDILNGRLGVGNAAPTVTLDVTGAAKISSTLTLSSMTQGQILFPGAGGVLSGSNSLNWDNTNNILKATSPFTQQGQHILQWRTAVDSFFPNPGAVPGAALLSLTYPDPAISNAVRKLEFSFYSFGEVIKFTGDGSTAGNAGSVLEFWGADQAGPLYRPVMTLAVGSATHEVHIARNITDTDAIICSFVAGLSGTTGPTGPTIYTETGGSTTLDLGVRRTGVARVGTTFLGAFTDNGMDCGGTTQRWRTGYFGTSIGIGTITPRTPLDVLSTAGPQIRATYTDNTAYAALECDSLGRAKFTNTDNQTFFLYNTSSITALGLTGQFNIQNAGSAFSTVGNTSASIQYFDGADASQAIAGSFTNHNFVIRTNNTLAATFDTSQNLTLVGSVTMADAKNFILNTTTGTKIGTATSQKLGFFNAAPVVQQTRGATFTNNITVGGTTDSPANWTDLTTYATDAAAIRNFCYQMARAMNQHDVALRALGLLS